MAGAAAAAAAAPAAVAAAPVAAAAAPAVAAGLTAVGIWEMAKPVLKWIGKEFTKDARSYGKRKLRDRERRRRLSRNSHPYSYGALSNPYF